MPEYEVVRSEELKMVKVTLKGDTVRSESGALHYMKGDIQMQTKMPGVGKMLKSLVSKEDIFRPTYTGTGEAYFGPPSFDEYHILELNNESWVLDQGAYVCSDFPIEIGVVRNKGISMVFGSEGIFQTTVNGSGTVVFKSPGPIEEVHLNGETLTVDGSFAVAREGSLDFKTELLGKGVMSKVAGGEGFVNVISGTGKVLLAPVPTMWNSIVQRSILGLIPFLGNRG
ncbi:MAG: AIM24 family protein [Candidatus Thermoplasmatota archaeon]|nr:AIM24 family protein [Candidatus Thermoplasmatota archaeon]MEE2629774.1 AIM24 family protein [Candidatus Thermoplasmatota archaeon]|tara:strand:+ start:318 stop:998 length:681 start_codon:yes stop_codon:yes gene_type:complete